MKDKKPLPQASPESVGIASADILRFVKKLEDQQLNMHSYLIIRRGKIISEGYWEPFSEGQLHRMYSVSKTFASAAIGLLCDEGKIALSDKVIKYFPDKLPETVHPYVADMTIRDLLMMATPYTNQTYGLQFSDWAWTFFNTQPSHPAGTVFTYDTSGSFILDVIVERVTGKPFLSYMRERMLDEIGFSEDTWCVKSPEGYSWGGSGVMCTTRDLAKFALVFLCGGMWNGKRLLSAEYISEATSRQIDNCISGWKNDSTDGYGYGYQIWMTRDGSYSFIGMGDQLAVCISEHDMVFVCTADNQGHPNSRSIIYSALWDEIINNISDVPLPESGDFDLLNKKNLSLKPIPMECKAEENAAAKINGVKYNLGKSHSCIEWSYISFDGDGGVWHYKNATGECKINFGIGCFREGAFPNPNYFGDTISKPRGRGYRYIANGAWTESQKFVLRVFIIDDYFGNMTVTFSYKNDEISLYMSKTAEWFLDEYQSFAAGIAEK